MDGWNYRSLAGTVFTLTMSHGLLPHRTVSVIQCPKNNMLEAPIIFLTTNLYTPKTYVQSAKKGSTGWHWSQKIHFVSCHFRSTVVVWQTISLDWSFGFGQPERMNVRSLVQQWFAMVWCLFFFYGLERAQNMWLVGSIVCENAL